MSYRCRFPYIDHSINRHQTAPDSAFLLDHDLTCPAHLWIEGGNGVFHVITIEAPIRGLAEGRVHADIFSCAAKKAIKPIQLLNPTR